MIKDLKRIFILIFFINLFFSMSIFSDEYRFVKNLSTVYEEENKINELGKLGKARRVKLIETKEFEVEKIKKDKKSILKYNVAKISYKDVNKEKIAWIDGKNLVKKREEVLNDSLKKIDFTSLEKLEYPNNKKVKVKGIYVSANSISLKGRLDELIRIAKVNGINAFVIDVKDDFGEITFPISNDLEKYSKKANKKPIIRDINKVMEKLKNNGIYTIARIVSFKDPLYANENKDKVIVYRETGKPFTNKDGILWISPYDKKLWEYNIFVAKEASKVGFNEIQFDYVRFPASNGGKLDKILDYRVSENKSKAKLIQEYLDYARRELKNENVYISADVYGQIGSLEDDMGLGQYWEAVSSKVDYISPMMYPSHYGKGVYGLAVPDANPYKTIFYSTRDSINRNNNIDNPAIIRPWIQAFTAKWVKGHINYGVEEIRKQVQALKDLGVEEYILWSPTNRYEAYF